MVSAAADAPVRRILVVGLERELFDKLTPLLSRSHFAVDRVPRGASGLALAGHARFDLIVVRHPLPDLDAHAFLQGLRSQRPSGSPVEVLVLTDSEQLEQTRRSLAPAQVFSVAEPWRLLEQVASRLLHVAPRVDARLLIRLDVKLEAGKEMTICPSHNLSSAGALVRTDRLYPIGTEIGFEIKLPGDTGPVRGRARVVRHSVADVEAARGVGVKFEAFDREGRQLLQQYLDRAAKTQS